MEMIFNDNEGIAYRPNFEAMYPVMGYCLLDDGARIYCYVTADYYSRNVMDDFGNLVEIDHA